jgi:hypothetical protein
LVYLADVVAVYHRHGGLESAVAVAKERSGTAFDPSLVDLFCSQAEVLLSDLDSASSWDTVIAAEPQLELLVSGVPGCSTTSAAWASPTRSGTSAGS